MSGTSSQGHRKEISFNADELCRILEVSKTLGVEELSVGDLRIRFGGHTPTLVTPLPQQTVGEPQPVPNHTEQSQESLELDELREKEERVAMLILEDPVEFERQLAAGELDEEITDDSGSSDDE